jgi:molecular chaperone DnaK (HSP70)
MGAEEERPQTFVESVLALLEERFPWLGSGQDEPVGGADTVDELADLYKSLIEQRDKASRENGGQQA